MTKSITTIPRVGVTLLCTKAKNNTTINTCNHGSLTVLGYEDVYNHVTYAYDLYSKGLLRYCMLRVSSQDKAIDIVQESFVRVWWYLLNGKHIENDKSFLYTTARHLIIDEYRKKKTVSLESLYATQDVILIEHYDNEYTLAEIAYMLRNLSHLPPLYSTILAMRYIDDYSVKKIAKLLSVSENIVSVRIHRGIEKMRIISGVV
jgi:RNA polymerase sigma-70 factor (ECF subfamily)